MGSVVSDTEVLYTPTLQWHHYTVLFTTLHYTVLFTLYYTDCTKLTERTIH